MKISFQDSKGYYSNVFLPKQKLFINNQFVDSKSGKNIDVINPTTEKVICICPCANKDDVDDAVQAAKHAFISWKNLKAAERSVYLLKLADLIEKHKAEIAVLESLDTGKPMKNTLKVDVHYAIESLKYNASLCDKINGKYINDSEYLMYVVKEPVGVCAQIIPWNFPFALLVSKLASCLAPGCVVVSKVSEETPLSAFRLAELISEAHYPAGVVNILTGYGDIAGEALVRHPNIDKISFTGSTRVGKIIQSIAANSIKRVTLELCGKSASCICEDADVFEATKVVCDSIFGNSGQCCNALSRVFVHDTLYETFLDLATGYCSDRKICGPFCSTEDEKATSHDPLHVYVTDSDSDQGPSVTKKQYQKVLKYIEIGLSEGARLYYGGKRHGTHGRFIEPTIFVDVTQDMKISQDEIFGPVLCVSRYKTDEEAVNLANSGSYGLWANVWTSSIDRAIFYSKRLEAGTVTINCNDSPGCLMPFGGYKESGIGRERGIEGVEEYTETKSIIMKMKQMPITD